MDIQNIFLLFGVGLLAGFINVNAGGGSTLTLPLLMFLGLNGATANGTNRVAIFIQNIFAVWGFNQEKKSTFKKSFLFSLFTLPGAVIGAFLAIKISDALFKQILAGVLIFVIISMFLPRPGKEGTVGKKESVYLYLALFGAGFYGGFIQAGVGFIFMAILYHLARENLVAVNVHKVFIILIYTLPAILIFALSGNIDWIIGIILSAGNATGGWIAARISVQKGDKFIRLILILTLLIFAYKLLVL